MAQCRIRKKSLMYGNKVSHSNIKTRRKFHLNTQKKWIFNYQTGYKVRLIISTKALRTLNKNKKLIDLTRFNK